MQSNSNLHDKFGIPSNIVIAVAGTVGIGKSSLTKALSCILGLNYSFESVDDNPYLEKFYSDQKFYGFHLQIYFLTEKIKSLNSIASSKKGFIQDRTIYEDVEIFAKMNYEKGNMNHEDYKTYKSLYESIRHTLPKPDLVIYLDADIETVLGRISERGRSGEVKTSEKYWYELYDRYTRWIDNYTHSPVLKINVSEYDILNDPNSIKVVLTKIGEMSETILTKRLIRK